MKVLVSSTDYLNKVNDFSSYRDKLEEKRWEQITRCRNLEDKKRILTAGLLLHEMCQEYQIKNPVYEYDQHGKGSLSITNGKVPFFNLSHSGKYAVCAYDMHPVGVDIQARRITSEAMAARFLNIMEMEELPEDLTRRIAKVNRLWCIKESFVKLIGLGLSYDMRDCIVDLNKHHVIDISGRYGTAYFKEYDMEEDYFLSVCSMQKFYCEQSVIIEYK